MKKVIMLAAAALMIGSTAQSQDVFKQTGGEKNIEVQFAPFGGSPIAISGIRYRSFTSATTALRAEVFLGLDNSTEIIGMTGNDEELRRRNGSFDVSLSGGFEKHLTGTDRLSPYYGAIATVGFSRTSMREEFTLKSNDIEENTTTDGSLSIGVAGVGGVDYYFADNIYIGAEIGFGVNWMTEFDTKMSSTVEGSEEQTMPNGGGLQLGPVAQGRLRLGILF